MYVCVCVCVCVCYKRVSWSLVYCLVYIVATMVRHAICFVDLCISLTRVTSYLMVGLEILGEMEAR